MTRLLMVLGILAGLALGGGAVQPGAAASTAGPSAADRDRDGYPDAAELTGSDRARFADWFAAIAESQYTRMNADWRPEDRDCGGLLRYAFVNALTTHDAGWLTRFAYFPRPRLGPVQALRYPLPLLSRSVFRVAGGAYQAGDVEAGRLVGRTGVQHLATHSMRQVSRELASARRGDLLIFLRPGLRSYHSMVYLGGGRVVYHTGASPAEGGEVRLLTVQNLRRGAERAFHPVGSNPNFLGVYRWKILD